MKLKVGIILVLLSVFTFFMVGYGREENHKESTELTIFAASSLTESFSEIGAVFEKAHPGVKVNLNFANSQVLFSQLLNGAQADIFAPAGDQYLKKAEAEGLIEKSQAYGQNSLVVAIPPSNPQNIKNLQDLENPCKIIMVVKEAPAGKYALDVLDRSALRWGEEFKNNVINNVTSYEPNVKQAVAKITLNEADAAFVYYGDVVELEKQGKVAVISIPEDLNVKAVYSAGTVSDSGQPDLVGEFSDFLLGEEAQAILEKYGMNL